MDWLFFAILSPAIYTVVTYFDRYIVEREIPRPLAIPIYSSIVAVIVGTIFFLLGSMQTLPLVDALLVMLTGAFTTWGAVLYFEAIASAETSSVIVLFQMVPVIVLILSFLFLGERITLLQGIGFILILGATIIVSIEPGGRGIRLSRAFFLVMGVDLLWALTAVIFKFVSGDYEFIHLAAYESFGMAAGGVLLLIVFGRIRRAFLDTLSMVRGRAFGLLGINEALFVAAKLTNLLAIALGPVSLVIVLGGTGVFFGFTLGWALTVLAPTVFNEDIRRHILLRKGLMTIIVILGVYLVS